MEKLPFTVMGDEHGMKIIMALSVQLSFVGIVRAAVFTGECV
jgi:hypothetical protein